MMPSRDFLVRQAVLNAGNYFKPREDSVPDYLRSVLVRIQNRDGWIGNIIFERVRSEFRTLTQRYSEAA